MMAYLRFSPSRKSNELELYGSHGLNKVLKYDLTNVMVTQRVLLELRYGLCLVMNCTMQWYIAFVNLESSSE